MRKSLVVTALGLAAFFVFVISMLFDLRFDRGDIYPPYSSLRADPMGTRVLYESLARMPGLSVWRNTERLDVLKGFDGTVFFLGVHSYPESAWGEKRIAELEQIAIGGGRLVIGLRGDEKIYAGEFAKPFEIKKWNVRFAYGDGYLVLEDTADRDRRVGTIERQVGKGTVVLIANAFDLSNEAMIGRRDAERLIGFVGPHMRVVFEESHFGIQEGGGVAQLARNYGLAGFAAACAILAMLFIWQRSLSLVPPLPDQGASGSAVDGRDSAAGFVNLLRRSIAERDVLNASVEQWRKTAHTGRGYSAHRMEMVEQVLRGEGKDPVAAWRRIRQILHERMSA